MEKDIAVDEAADVEEEEGVRREADIHERHEGDELEGIDEGPERLKGGLAEIRRPYRQHCEMERMMRRRMELPAIAPPIP